MNQREIKFRAWDRDKKEMRFAVFVDEIGLNYPITEEEIPDQMPIMQFTGLKDKNGKEIYEGDIYEIEENSLNGKIKRHWSFELSGGEGSTGFYNWIGYSYPNDIQIEIIGNIYENPELINPN